MLSKKFPTLQEIASVYAVGMVIVYSDTVIKFFYEFPSWNLFISILDIGGLFAYAMAGAFVESLILIAALLVLHLLLPQKITSGKFVLYGTILIVALLGSLMLRYQIGTKPAMAVFGIILALLLALGWRFKIIGNIFEGLADRCLIFLYIYAPITFISILIIVARNIG